jgi:uncharacterized Tic20 family protein
MKEGRMSKKERRDKNTRRRKRREREVLFFFFLFLFFSSFLPSLVVFLAKSDQNRFHDVRGGDDTFSLSVIVQDPQTMCSCD